MKIAGKVPLTALLSIMPLIFMILCDVKPTLGISLTVFVSILDNMYIRHIYFFRFFKFPFILTRPQSGRNNSSSHTLPRIHIIFLYIILIFFDPD